MSDDSSIPVDEIVVFDEQDWDDGPPNDMFKRMRSECPVHWTDRMPDYPEEAGYWSVTTAEGVKEVSHDWQTYSSAIGGIAATTNVIFPLELMQSMFIAMDPPIAEE